MSWASDAARGGDHINWFDPAFPLPLLTEQNAVF